MSRQQLQNIFTALPASIQISFLGPRPRCSVRFLSSPSPGPRLRSTSESLPIDMDEFENIDNNTPVLKQISLKEDLLNTRLINKKLSMKKYLEKNKP